MDPLCSLAGVSVVVPAAGIGSRMLSMGAPKQYMKVFGKSILQITLEKIFLLKPDRVILVVSPSDNLYKLIDIVESCEVVVGGTERTNSVLNGLSKLEVNDLDLVMVHDAVRPCVRTSDILRLANAVKDHRVGGLLAIPVSETLKTVVRTQVKTIDRSGVWQAQTPQIFRYRYLFDSISRALLMNYKITDESQAIEYFGYEPLLLKGHRDNVKITEADDIDLIRYYLENGKCE